MVNKITKIEIVSLYLNDYGRKYYLGEMADLLGKPHQTIKPYAEELVQEGVLLRNKRKNIIDYGLNFSNSKVYDYLVIAEKYKKIKALDKERLLLILYGKIDKYTLDSLFVVFGSSVDGLKKGSDIDLLVVGKEKISEEIKEFEEIYNKKIHKVQVLSLKELGLTLTKEIYKKHIILNDTEKVIRYFGELYGQNKLV